jgi:hypothetical protein
MSFVSLALKEWAVITRALARGEQFLVLRKGGIREQQRRFVVEGNRFLLYPTYEHQSKDLLKPQWHDALDLTVSQAPSPDTVIIDTLAEVVEILEVTEPERVEALEDFYICTGDYAQYRLKWRPKHPLSIILLRTMKLKRAFAVPVLPRYGGCVSWVELEEPVNVTGAQAVVSDETLRSKIMRIREAVGTAVPV